MHFQDIPANNLATNIKSQTDRLGRVVTLRILSLVTSVRTSVGTPTMLAERVLVIFLGYSKQIPEEYLD
jgi:hypothetical protein